MYLLLKIFILWFCFEYVKSQEMSTMTPTTEEIEITMPHLITDAPKFTVDDVLFIDHGRYENLSKAFYFNNFQNFVWYTAGDTFCYEEYRTCTNGLTANMPVCAFNNPHIATGYFTGLSYCDIYLDNCRRGKRVWRIIDYGKCKFIYNNDDDNVLHTRRINKPLLIKLLRIASKPARDVITSDNIGEILPTNRVNSKMGKTFPRNREIVPQSYRKDWENDEYKSNVFENGKKNPRN